ncbi:MmcB family DNA repair protein [Breoghania sp.]|uniref:MmcB family DNA repair protein n=1 Tax=Breoghania sp. TaxID=2065378 RepID=UPI0026174563|nr:MmcB family DNA repair protein [Breoghania sp.]MDJ0930338.1 MmcB family DNA repair protein [Breoghania sp.]
MNIFEQSIAAGLIDGRQSEAALMAPRGVSRLLRRSGAACVMEFTLPTGRRADLIAMGAKGEIWIVEVKSSVADFRSDSKWPDYQTWCDRLFFTTHPEVPADIFPQETGLIMSDRFGADVLRQAPEHPLPASRRKVLTLKLAQCAANRLHDLMDPAMIRGEASSGFGL